MRIENRFSKDLVFGSLRIEIGVQSFEGVYGIRMGKRITGLAFLIVRDV